MCGGQCRQPGKEGVTHLDSGSVGSGALSWTLAAAAGWAAVCYGTHMADTVGYKDMWLEVGL